MLSRPHDPRSPHVRPDDRETPEPPPSEELDAQTEGDGTAAEDDEVARLLGTIEAAREDGR